MIRSLCARAYNALDRLLRDPEPEYCPECGSRARKLNPLVCACTVEACDTTYFLHERMRLQNGPPV